MACASVGLSFVLSLLAFFELKWMPSERAHDRAGAVHLDSVGSVSMSISASCSTRLSAVMILVVTGVGFLIHVYSVGYMAHDPGYGRYFAYLNLFMFSMLTLVLANNFLLMFVGWEGVGLCSYLLIGFWFEKQSASDAGKKAFIVNRIGDFGFLLGMFIIFWQVGSLDFPTVMKAAPDGLCRRRRLDHRRLSAAVPRRDRQVGADSAVCLAAGRYGRPDAGLGADPCRDHGDRRCLHDRAHQMCSL